MTDLERAVRTIEEMIPELSTTQLEKWKGILTTATAKIDKELVATCLHTCTICFLQEWGYRNELPTSWYKKGSAELCFQHEYDQAEKLLKDAGFADDAFFPEEVSAPSVGALKVAMKELPPPPSEKEQTLDELMDLL